MPVYFLNSHCVAHWVSRRSSDTVRRSIRSVPLPKEALLELQAELLWQAGPDKREEPQASVQLGEGEQDYKPAQHGLVNDEQDEV